MLRASSGSRSASSSIDPLRSAKRTVTCLRSPSSMSPRASANSNSRPWLAVHLNGHLTELDINPLMVLPAGRGVKAVDALAVLPSA